jgi:hypothetical protein
MLCEEDDDDDVDDDVDDDDCVMQISWSLGMIVTSLTISNPFASKIGYSYSSSSSSCSIRVVVLLSVVVVVVVVVVLARSCRRRCRFLRLLLSLFSILYSDVVVVIVVCSFGAWHRQ